MSRTASWSGLLQPWARNEQGQRVGHALADWRGADWPPPQRLEGRWCRLEALDAERHGPALFSSLHREADGAGWTYLNQGPFPDQQDWARALAGFAARAHAHYYALVSAKTGLACGIASYLHVCAADGVLEIGGVHLSPEVRRSRAATEMFYLMLRQAFEQGFRRCEWRCDAHNEASARAALRLGFTFEALWRQRRVSKGRNRDAACFSMLDHEWPARRAALERWLAADNFDEAGQQRRSLAEFG